MTMLRKKILKTYYHASRWAIRSYIKEKCQVVGVVIQINFTFDV